VIDVGLGRWLRERARKTLRIARWEVTKNAGGVDRTTIVVALIAIVGLGAVVPMAVSQGVALDRGIYRVGVEESSPYYGVVDSDPTFVAVEPNRAAVAEGRQEILIRGAAVIDYADTQKGRAALESLRSSVQRYNDRRMVLEPNQSAAFPVRVELRYRDRDLPSLVNPETIESEEIGSDGGETATGETTAGGATDGGGATDRSGDGTGTVDDGATPSGGDDAQADGTADGGGSGDGDGTGTARTDGGVTETVTEESGGGIADRLSGGGVSGTPSDITPPFPFRSLVLAFVFVLPLNFIIQAYGSTMLSERINRRGELLLVAPVARGDIIVGKTLPYFAGAMAFAAVIAAVLGGTALTVLAVAPIAMLFLSSTFLGAMFARSFKELTFVTVTVTVSLTTYAFVPAIFTDVTPIALISPLTIVVRDLQGQVIGLGEFVFSTAPPAATAMVLFGLGAGLYREEDMFTQRPIPLKVLDALAGRISSKKSVGFVTAILLPFVLVAELLAIAMLFALQGLSIPLVLIAVAIIEEVAKSLHVYAGYVHNRFDDGIRTALVVGTFSGLGFFVAEKGTLIARLGDLQGLQIGRAGLEQAALLNPLLLSFLAAPLLLHVVTASISALGARRDRRSYAAALAVAMAVHVAYNLTVVRILAGV
jgi:ABC-type Na+ efflux pump permease subunit